MIYGFPQLYKDELFISALSRFSVNLGIHRGFTFMNYLYDGHPQYPSFELTTDLNKLNLKLDQHSKVDKDEIIRFHTMFPLHSSFVEEKVKTKVYQALFEGKSLITPASQLGLMNKFTTRGNQYKYCSLCIQEMKKNHGQYYWKRTHQIVGVEVCVKHNCMLFNSTAIIHKDYRYPLTAASPNNCNTTHSSLSEFENIAQEKEFNLNVTRLINEIFKLPNKKPPTLWQWTHFYRDLANENGLIITENLILDRMALIYKLDPIFKFSWLAKKSINQEMEIYNRIELIFYKHVSSFNYLIHIFIWAIFYENPNVPDIFDRVTQYPKQAMHHIKKTPNHTPSIFEKKNKRISWKKILKENKSKKIEYIKTEIAQIINNWFIKYDKEWFDLKNNEFTDSKTLLRNWSKVDSNILNTLKQIHVENHKNQISKRQSKYWYMSQSKFKFNKSNLSNLPSTIKFISEYSETVPMFQIRRFSNSLLNFNFNSKTTITTLLNYNSLYQYRLKIETKQFAEWIIPYFSSFSKLPDDVSDNYFGTNFEIDRVKYPELKALLNSKAAYRLNFILRLFGGLINTDGE